MLEKDGIDAGTHRHVLVALPVASDDVVTLLLEPLGEVRGDDAIG